MSLSPHYNRGEWNTICDACGFQAKNSELVLRWDGVRVHKRCWEPRHPQDYVRAKVDIQAAPWTRPEPIDSFTGLFPFIAGIAIANLCFPTTIPGPGVTPASSFTP